MKITIDRKNETLAHVELVASIEELTKVKNKVLKQLSSKVKLAGFRDGKAPLPMVEKSIDSNLLQSEFLEEAINTLYVNVIQQEKLRPVSQPKVEVTKFVPFTTLEIEMDIPVIGKISIPDYKKSTIKKEKVSVSDDEITGVMKNLQTRAAEKNDVDRAAKNGDEAWIDFSGKDSKGEPVSGADGKDYPLVLGSGTFIPGFEENVIGMKIGEEKSFPVTFPKDYGAKALQNKKVTFTVKLHKVKEVVEPKLDDAFAKTVGPFGSLKELKEEINKQLTHEAEHKAERDFEAALVNDLAKKTKVSIPEDLLKEQEDMVISELRQNVVYRGMTYEEYLKSLGMSEEEYRKNEVAPEAERRVKAGLLLSEIADENGIDVTAEELEVKIQQLKGQYSDQQMQEELNKPENRRDINARLRSEKVIEYIKSFYATK